MNFGQALEALKQNEKVSRSGWNGKGMWIALQVPIVDGWRPYLYMKTVDNEFVPWTVSQSDVLADDWGIVR